MTLLACPWSLLTHIRTNLVFGSGRRAAEGFGRSQWRRDDELCSRAASCAQLLIVLNLASFKSLRGKHAHGDFARTAARN